MFQEFTLIEASSPVSVFIEHRILIGKSVVFGSPCFLGDAVTVGDGVIFSGEANIGRHTVIEAGARIGKGCILGKIPKNVERQNNV